MQHLVQILKSKGIVFEHGLTNDEVSEVEKSFNFIFPPDLKLFLQTALPMSEGFVNWRLGLSSHEEKRKIIDRLEWPLEGMLFDIENSNFWMRSWGEQPADYEAKVQIAKQHYLSYPKLIPIYSHRYIPDCPGEMGNPVFSVYQMDIVYYGVDLETYFANEFFSIEDENFNPTQFPERKIEFWSMIAESENIYGVGPI